MGNHTSAVDYYLIFQMHELNGLFQYHRIAIKRGAFVLT